MLIRVLGLAALVGLAGCVGAPEGPYAPAAYAPAAYAPPQAYAPTYATTPGYAQPGYAQPGYAPAYQAPVAQVASGGRCYAGIYTCELAAALPVGSQCSCPGLGAPSFGTVR